MPWMIGLIIIAILILIPKRSYSKKKKEFFLKESIELQEMKDFAKESLTKSNKIITIKTLRKKYCLSLVDAKKVMDSAVSYSKSWFRCQTVKFDLYTDM